jgi:hypothetical protein
MKLKHSILLFAAAAALTLSSCYYDSEEELYPGTAGGNCDTTAVSFSATIQPILAANCNSCHNATTANGGVITDNYDALMIPVNAGVFHKAVNHLPGAVPMPFNGQKLPQCELMKINAWLNQGAPNN